MLASQKNDKPRQSIRKQRRHFACKGPFTYMVKTMVSPAVKHGCETWTIRKAECWRTDALELWCWRRLLRVPWTARRSVKPKGNQPWGLVLNWSSNTFITWCEELTHWKRPWCWERLRATGVGSYRRWNRWMTFLIQGTWVWATSGR